MSDKKLLQLEKLLNEYLKEKMKYIDLPIKYFHNEEGKYLLEGLKENGDRLRGLESINRCLIEVKQSVALQINDKII